ncbi:nucleoside diphosphate kinase [Basidiobolus meristosporus CBS 931.73]|uniref:Nucleoside diphosphate kinase n=1 Tax=Basidiobolus meristosporus CBS 931.73 TaxID=1314790 RepID=A0A1Y1X9I3_9FUNG|nr:nucleoside diphosphate kinase [Basidiobolus meristosporus CBS 931.73]|eukprot:ORX82407.1 nucleoside diphosphate kinase [Basidiobolus meristosporus CBS 931.73]
MRLYIASILVLTLAFLANFYNWFSFSELYQGISQKFYPQPVQNTLALVKPDAYNAGHLPAIRKRIQMEGFSIVMEKEMNGDKALMSVFYEEHKERPFFEELTNWMSSAPFYAMVLQKPDAIKSWRALMGPTNSHKARENSPSSIRAQFGKDGSENAVHGSDSPESASREIKLIFGSI